MPETGVAETAEIQTDDVNALKEQVQRLTDERDQAKDQLLRTMADFQNFRKRTQQETETIRQFATERLIGTLLPVLDNFERTMAALDNGANTDAIVTGIRAVERQLRTVLEGQNVSRIEAMGAAFDPDLHEAIAAEHSEEHPEGTVLAELEPGYRISQKVIRPARVKVSKKH
jgi:molecular chaperone GrpE